MYINLQNFEDVRPLKGCPSPLLSPPPRPRAGMQVHTLYGLQQLGQKVPASDEMLCQAIGRSNMTS